MTQVETHATIRAGMLGAQGRAALGPHPGIGGNDARLFVGYDRWAPTLLDDLRSAEHVINIVEYNWEPTGIGRDVAEILMAKARAGVEVNVLTDKHGSFGGDSETWKSGAAGKAEVNELFDRMRAAGVNVTVSDPGRARWFNPLKRELDHRKVIDVDHRVTHIGGMGWAESPRGKYHTWFDMFGRFEGPVAAQSGAEIIARLQELGVAPSERNLSLLSTAMEHPARVGAANVRTLPNHPRLRTDATDDFYASAASVGPGERFWVATPYIGDKHVADALLGARARGADVRLLVPGAGVKQNPLFSYLSRTFYEDLVAGGVPVYGSTRMMHAKAWVTGTAATVGSTNLSRGSLRYYLELSASVRDAGFAADLAAALGEEMARSQLFTEADLHRPGIRALRFIRQRLHLWF